jgi:antitoxin MazE
MRKMKTTIIPIGNSKGIRIPKAVLEQCNFSKDVSLEVKGDCLITKPLKRKPRAEWEKYFENMSKNKEDKLIIEDQLEIAMEDWEW